jgi:alkanesulfonate monooxygenase SsuD/methylene tetrahydromethanopterin reductase-like flavin-dependent oxidoreductase (luciferase family)
VWFGAASPPAYRRAGRLGDGWFPQLPPGPKLDEARSHIAEGATEAGRDPGTLGMEGRVTYTGDVAEVVRLIGAWRDAGATHVGVNTMRAGLETVDDHLRVLGEVAEVLGLEPAE